MYELLLHFFFYLLSDPNSTVTVLITVPIWIVVFSISQLARRVLVIPINIVFGDGNEIHVNVSPSGRDSTDSSEGREGP